MIVRIETIILMSSAWVVKASVAVALAAVVKAAAALAVVVKAAVVKAVAVKAAVVKVDRVGRALDPRPVFFLMESRELKYLASMETTQSLSTRTTNRR